MLNKQHSIDIIVNGEMVDIYSQEKLNLRINNVVFSPTNLSSKTGEYSFSFELPATSKNNRIFNYANNSSKLNKFNTKYACDVIVDGTTIFSGILRLTDTKTKNYKANLVNIKLQNVSDIFQDMMMSDLVWEVDFNGTSTINSVNEWYDSGYYFPLVSYGAFQKDPKAVYNSEIHQYTDLLTIDYYNKWYWESFHPSLSVLEVVKRLFRQKGFNVSGDVFNDRAMKMIYMSEYIDSSQDPTYNLNKAEIGNLHIAGHYTNNGNISGSTTFGARRTSTSGQRAFGKTVISTFQDLTFPKEKVYEDTYQWDRIAVYDIFGSAGTNYHTFTTEPTNSYIYRQNSPYNKSGFIYVPSDGLYTIELTVSNLSIAGASDQMTYAEKYLDGADIETRRTSISKDFESMPVEIHLVRNSNETELIGTCDPDTKIMWPQEMDYTKYVKINRDTGTSGTTGGTSPSGTGTSGGTFGGSGVRRAPAQGGTRNVTTGNFGGSRSRSSFTIPDEIFYTRKAQTIAYDPFANPNFICGFTTMNESPAVIKNGVSWNASVTDFNQSHFRCQGYISRDNEGTETQSDYNKNTLNCPNSDYFSASGTLTRNGKITCVVELKKNDILYLQMVTRLYYDVEGIGRSSMPQATYAVSFDYDIKFTPYSDKKDQFVNVQNLPYLPTEETKNNGWGEKLRLGNFLNSKEKAADFITNFIKSFNLDYIQDGKNIILNKAKKVIVPLNYVDLDDRVNTDNMTFQRIDYPASMAVKWAIDEEEAGAYRSIPTVQQQSLPNWKDYIDRGYDKITMDINNETNDDSIESKWSYCWYQDFTYRDFNRETFTENGHIVSLRLPLIAKDENFIVQNDEAMKKDGLSLKQRLWFRDQPIQDTFMMWNGDEVVVSIPNDTYWGYIMNYKQEVGSMLTTYFNVIPMIDSNFALVEVYITPFEYNQFKNGAMARVDNDLYIVSEIQGYDPTGNNTTTLKLIKVV